TWRRSGPRANGAASTNEDRSYEKPLPTPSSRSRQSPTTVGGPYQRRAGWRTPAGRSSVVSGGDHVGWRYGRTQTDRQASRGRGRGNERRGMGAVRRGDAWLPAEAIREGASDDRPGHGQHDGRGVHERYGHSIEVDVEAQVERHEHVEHAQATAAAAEHAGD